VLVMYFLLAGVEYLPAQGDFAEDFLAGVFDQMTGVVAVVVPILPRTMHHFADQNGSAALRKEEQRKACGEHGPGVASSDPLPGTVWLLVRDKVFRAGAVPVVGTEKTLARQPAGPLDAVKVVIVVFREINPPVATLVVGAEVLADPVQRLFNRLVLSIDSAIAC